MGPVFPSLYTPANPYKHAYFCVIKRLWIQDKKHIHMLSSLLSVPSDGFVAHLSCLLETVPDNKVHGANMGPTWVLSAPERPHVGPMNHAIRGISLAVGFMATSNASKQRSYCSHVKAACFWCGKAPTSLVTTHCVSVVKEKLNTITSCAKKIN